MTESTYGDRVHEDATDKLRALWAGRSSAGPNGSASWVRSGRSAPGFVRPTASPRTPIETSLPGGCGDSGLRPDASSLPTARRYHWKDFEEIKLIDPITNESLELHEYMEYMAGAFGGIANDLQQGQLDNARNNYKAFSARFDGLAKNACKQCHQDRAGREIPRKYFVDEEVKGMIAQLGQMLSAPTPDAKAIGELSGGIGNESCMKCHLVHFPAAQAKERLEKYADLFQ